jgi:hypothetical protein
VSDQRQLIQLGYQVLQDLKVRPVHQVAMTQEVHQGHQEPTASPLVHHLMPQVLKIDPMPPKLEEFMSLTPKPLKSKIVVSLQRMCMVKLMRLM